jgi:RNA polymerase sigma-70 factor (ECF subfamily)
VTVPDNDLLTQRFETHRPHLRAVALRMLGSSHGADDAVQEAWLRLNRTDADTVENLGGWLTTVVARICLDMLRSRGATHEVAGGTAPEPEPAGAPSPEDDVVMADSVGLALLIVLETLTPAERLHDLFAVPFEEIAPIVGRSTVATRQLASRARRRVQTDPAVPGETAAIQRQVVSAFLAAAREGDFAELLHLLDPDVVLRADEVAVDLATARAGAGAPDLQREMRGLDAVSRVFAGRAKAARLMLVDGLAGAVVHFGGKPAVVFDFTVRRGHIVGIDLLADPETISSLALEAVPR